MMSYNCQAKRFKFGEERECDNANETMSSIDENPGSPIDAKLASCSTPQSAPLSSITNKFAFHNAPASYQYNSHYNYGYYPQEAAYNFNYYQTAQPQYGQVFNRNSIGSSGSDTSSNGLASPQPDFALAKSAAQTNNKKRRAIPVENKDEAYWEKRRKNNESAKRSRDMRRSKEEHISIRVIYLEQENLQLKTELALMKTETEKLRAMLYAASNSAAAAAAAAVSSSTNSI